MIDVVPRDAAISAVAALLLAAAIPARGGEATQASAAPDTVPIRTATADADSDFRPDRLGDTLTVAGRATVASGVLNEGRLVVFLEDSTGGVQLYADEIATPIGRGDRVVATGVVGHYNGQTQLEVLEYSVTAADGPGPAPSPLTDVDSTQLEAREGRLVRLSSLVLGRGSNEGGDFLAVWPEGGDQVVQLFAANWRGVPLDISGYDPGDRVEVTGPLGQYDFSPPATEYYQIYPRSSDDLRRPSLLLGLTSGELRLAGGVALVLLLAAVGWWGARTRRRFRDLRDRHSVLFERNQAGVFRTTPEGAILDCNSALAEMYGFDSREAVLGARAWDLYPDYSDRAAYLRRLEQEGEVEDYVHEHRTRDGESVWVLENARLVEEDGDQQIVGTAVDITERIQADQRQKAAEERYRALFERNVAGAFRSAADGTLLEVNRAFARMLGYDDPEELEGEDAGELYASSERRDELMRELADEGVIENAEIALQGRDGETVWVLENSFVADDPETGERVNIGTITEITQHVEEERELEELAHRDPLTDIPNRRFLDEAVPRLLAQAERNGDCVGIVYLDLDDFKEINDRWGHGTGDAVLEALADRLRESVREADLVGRVGGDEFLVVLPGLDGKEGALAATRRLTERCFERPVEAGGELFPLTAKLGVAVSPTDGTSFDDLLRRADRAMYRASRTGQMVELYDQELDKPYDGRLKRHRAVREGLEDGTIVGYVQPIYGLAEGKIEGVELLARWDPEDDEPVGAGELLHAARAADLLSDLDRSMLRQGASFAARRNAGTVAVNLSESFLASDDAVAAVREILGDHPAAGDWLTVEITEKVALDEEVQSVVRELGELGLRLSLDDFGTGYSSLAVLEALEVDEVKVDRSLVSRIERSSRAEDLIEGVIDLAHSVGAIAVAEGVERDAQLEWLVDARCDRAQGFLLGRPRSRDSGLPAEIEAARRAAAEA